MTWLVAKKVGDIVTGVLEGSMFGKSTTSGASSMLYHCPCVSSIANQITVLRLKGQHIIPSPYWPPFRSSDISEYWIFCDSVILDGLTRKLDRNTRVTKMSKHMPVLCQEYMLFFCLPLSIRPRLNTQQQGCARGGRHTGGARPCCCVLSLGWLLNGKQKNSIYSWQRTGIYFWHVFN